MLYCLQNNVDPLPHLARLKRRSLAFDGGLHSSPVAIKFGPVSSERLDRPFQCRFLAQHIEIKNGSNRHIDGMEGAHNSGNAGLAPTMDKMKIWRSFFSRNRIHHCAIKSTVAVALADDHTLMKKSVEHAGITQQWVPPGITNKRWIQFGNRCSFSRALDSYDPNRGVRVIEKTLQDVATVRRDNELTGVRSLSCQYATQKCCLRRSERPPAHLSM
ncbi:hypothetical protein V1279_005867 [Bradyrhizobium sp. AZCC 1610]